MPLHIVKWPGPHLNADEEQDIRLSHYCEIGQPQISVTSDFDQNPGRTAEGDGVDRNAFANRNVQFCTIR